MDTLSMVTKAIVSTKKLVLAPSPSSPPPPEGDGLKWPGPSGNNRHCYNSGKKSDHVSITDAAMSFCDAVKSDDMHGHVWSDYRKTGRWSEVEKGCMCKVDWDESMQHLKVSINSCNCEGTDSKQGGTVEHDYIYARIDPNS
ncbi:hypothetical protein F4778DRAFT_790069 [Xylariomycetidae sp. FL2044]|nr:hypothetical protein F4778DRAFT_790069 [Xylariomycetidae sp. FL2044]